MSCPLCPAAPALLALAALPSAQRSSPSTAPWVAAAAPPPPCSLPALGRPPLPAHGGKPGDGTPTPRVSIWTVRKFFQKIIPGKETLRVTAPRPNFSRKKNRLANPAFRDDSRTSLRDPYLPPWSSPNRRFLVPMVAVSPLNRTLI